jgi:hypothetical protein
MMSQAPAAALQWDGQAWTLDGRPCQPRTMIDLGAWMLLRTEDRWIAVGARPCGAAWHPLRVALLAQRDAPAPR